MGRFDFFKPGDWNAICSMCGHKFKASDMVKNWQGQYRCRTCNEPRHSQDFVKAIPEKEIPAWIQPRLITFAPLCTPNGITALAGTAVAECVIAGFTHPAFNPALEE